jgi:hypothetical protein
MNVLGFTAGGKTTPLKAFCLSVVWTFVVIGVPASFGVFIPIETVVYGGVLICFSVAEFFIDLWSTKNPDASQKCNMQRWGITILTITLILMAAAILR